MQHKPANAKKLIASTALCFITILIPSACHKNEREKWYVRNEPTTPEERKAVAEQVTAIMASTPMTLSGDSQNWQKAIGSATQSAKESLCKPTLWESDRYGNWTGNWKHLDTPVTPTTKEKP